MPPVPTPFDKLRERYFSDPQFKHMVDSMVGVIANLNLSPGEMREAAVFAEIRFQEMWPSFLPRFDGQIVEDRLKELKERMG